MASSLRCHHSINQFQTVTWDASRCPEFVPSFTVDSDTGPARSARPLRECDAIAATDAGDKHLTSPQIGQAVFPMDSGPGSPLITSNTPSHLFASGGLSISRSMPYRSAKIEAATSPAQYAGRHPRRSHRHGHPNHTGADTVF